MGLHHSGASSIHQPAVDGVNIIMTEQRREELLHLWWEETNEDWTQEWRDELTPEEQALIDSWDSSFINGVAQMIQDSREGQRHGTKE